MTDKEFNIDNFKKNGFFIIKNILNEKELLNINKSFDEKKINSKYNEINDKNCWKYLTNQKLNENLKKILGDKIYYLHDLNINENLIHEKVYTWHRDSPCRRTGIGDDWYPLNSYNVLTTITYVCSTQETGSTLNVIPKSHLFNYKNSFSNILRFLHWKLKKSKFHLIKKIIEKINGKNLNFETGDCIIFYANLYHMGHILKNFNKKRKLIVSRFGGQGKHTDNYVNYILKHRDDTKNKYENSNIIMKNEFFQYLSEKEIFFSPPKEKKEINGVFVNKK